ncbi:MAG: hypothetical protein NTZ56_17000 [Acidobacteria bacterium]|nr:hypothetical protein [Acidobacteriota bacterium]
MLTLEQVVEGAAERGEFVHLMFEQRVFDLVGTLKKFSDPLQQAGVPHEVIGGLAVFIHVEHADSTHSSLTRDIDVLIRRADLDRVIAVAGQHGFRYRRVSGIDMLLYGETTGARNAIHLSFSGEKVKDTYLAPAPDVCPVEVSLYGSTFRVIPVADLLRMKLTSFRDEDRVHIRGMDAAGLLTADVEASLPAELRARLQVTRETE